MKHLKIILSVFLTMLLFLAGCAPSALTVSEEDIGTGKVFIINLMHLYGDRSTAEIVGGIISGGKQTHRNADQVYLFINKAYLSGLAAYGTGGATMAELLTVTPQKNAEIQMDIYKHFPKKLIGIKKINMDLEPEKLYAFVTEVEKSTENIHIDVYSISTDQLREIIKRSKGLSTFEFAELNYEYITNNEKVYSFNSFD